MLRPDPGGHIAYHNRVWGMLMQEYPDPQDIPWDIKDLVELFTSIDLSYVDTLLASKYSKVGRPGWLPSILFRSTMLSMVRKVSSVKLWVSTLRQSDMLSAIAGFEDRKHVAGVGTYYDFYPRLWNLNRPHLCASPQKIRPAKPKEKKPKNKGEKADSVDKETAAEAIARLEKTEHQLSEEPYFILFRIFEEIFLSQSIEAGLVDTNDMSACGDGTPIVTSARERKHRVCDCAEKGIQKCECDRSYSQPDTDVGYDSHRECFYCGYDAYFLTDSGRDLPVFVLLNPASKHDSLGFCETFTRFLAFSKYEWSGKMVLDSAHDAMAIYRYIKRKNFTPYIDLNLRNTSKFEISGITFDETGHPICRAGLPMKSNGSDRDKEMLKFRCPCMKMGKNRQPICTCANPCSDAKYGKAISVPMPNNPRIFNSPPRGSDEWKKIYNGRTASERVNKRVKVDFEAEAGHHRSTMMWYIRIYMAMMLVHARAWQSTPR